MSTAPLAMLCGGAAGWAEEAARGPAGWLVTMVELDTTKFTAVVFDMDGVITNTATVHARAWKRMFDEYLSQRAALAGVTVEPFTDDDYLRYVDGKQRQEGVESFLASRGIHLPRGEASDPPDRESLWGLANRKDKEFQRALKESGVDVFASSVALVRALQYAGLATAIVSASRNCQQVLEAGGIGDLFPVRVDGIDADVLRLAGKPSPAMFLEAARRLGLVPAQAVVVEDALAGVEAGRRGQFGLVVGVDRLGGGRGVSLLDAGADVVVSDLGEISVGKAASQLASDGMSDVRAQEVESSWSLVINDFVPDLERVRGTLLTLSNGCIGTHRAAVDHHVGTRPWAAMLGIYTGVGAETRLLTAPVALVMPYGFADGARLQRVLDLRAGILHETMTSPAGTVSSVQFASLAHPCTVAMRAHCPNTHTAIPLIAPADDPVFDDGMSGTTPWMRVAGTNGGIVAAAVQTETVYPDGHSIDRICAYHGDPQQLPSPETAVRTAQDHARDGFDSLMADNQRAWAARWADADIGIEGDDHLQLATRFMLFHLMSSVSDHGEAAVGARGLSGRGYRGHVFWDADTFVMPFLAATRPAAARAMLEYRVRRLPSAMEAARHTGHAGARFPWESAAFGVDVTPLSARDRAGRVIAIRTGQLEEHIVAEVAWAACCYIDWTGDDDFAHGDGLRILVETARYWASRIRVLHDGTGHILGVIGPDEYHEGVDDNAFTNVIARWNLRRAAAAVDALPGSNGVGTDEAQHWRDLAGRLVDGYDANTGVYEQFAGFYDLEPLIIAEVAPRRPVAADLLLGRARCQGAQVVKQADVLMLHHLVPSEVEPHSLEPNLRYYEPRTAHGSSLSPAIHASLFARIRDYPHALDALRMASRIDLDDLTATTGDGLHVATMGGVWQAFAYGFFGLRPRGQSLEIDPRLPPEWGALEIHVQFRGSHVTVRSEPRGLLVQADPEVDILLNSSPFTATPHGLELERDGATWRKVR